METIQLQSVGHVEAVPASELKEGDKRLFNFGSTALVVKVIEKTAKTLTIISYSESNGKYYMSDIRKSTLVAVHSSNNDISGHKPQEAYKVKGKDKGWKDVSEYFETVEESAEESEEKEPTQEQEKALNERINKPHVKPVKLYISKNGSVLLECMNMNLDNPYSFFFSYTPSGKESGKVDVEESYLNEFTVIKEYEDILPNDIQYKQVDERMRGHREKNTIQEHINAGTDQEELCTQLFYYWNKYQYNNPNNFYGYCGIEIRLNPNGFYVVYLESEYPDRLRKQNNKTASFKTYLEARQQALLWIEYINHWLTSEWWNNQPLHDVKEELFEKHVKPFYTMVMPDGQVVVRCVGDHNKAYLSIDSNNRWNKDTEYFRVNIISNKKEKAG